MDWRTKQKVAYCIPHWLRDEQIKLAIDKIKDRIKPGPERPEKIAVVAFGPSLNQTWEQVRDFKYIITCSGSHRFLIDRGIIPTWHVEVDPRAHKIQILGEPHKDVEYLPASTCHPKYFDHILKSGAKLSLWHIFDSKEEGLRLLPHGEWALTGGCDAGLRAVIMAAFFGFRDIHIFGMDQSAGTVGNPTERRHAAEHPNGKCKYDVCDYDGVKYLTTAGMLEAARSIEHELRMVQAAKTTFYGEGLCQHMARNAKLKAMTEGEAKYANVVAFAKPEVISASYRELNAQLHVDNLAYGVGGAKYAPMVTKIAQKIKAESILDYGCGKGLLAKALDFPIWEYDPAIVGKDKAPRPADLVVTTDVLEHIEPEMLESVINDLRRCTKKVGYHVIHTGPSGKMLADGRNTHLIQQGKDWWVEKLSGVFSVIRVEETPPLLHVFVVPKNMPKTIIEERRISPATMEGYTPATIIPEIAL